MIQYLSARRWSAPSHWLGGLCWLAMVASIQTRSQSHNSATVVYLVWKMS